MCVEGFFRKSFFHGENGILMLSPLLTLNSKFAKPPSYTQLLIQIFSVKIWVNMTKKCIFKINRVKKSDF
jgi:hypothetical protein